MQARTVLTRDVAERAAMEATMERLQVAGFDVVLNEGAGERAGKRVLVLATSAPYPVLHEARTAPDGQGALARFLNAVAVEQAGGEQR